MIKEGESSNWSAFFISFAMTLGVIFLLARALIGAVAAEKEWRAKYDAEINKPTTWSWRDSGYLATRDVLKGDGWREVGSSEHAGTIVHIYRKDAIVPLTWASEGPFKLETSKRLQRMKRARLIGANE